jgi:hypothetical protein
MKNKTVLMAAVLAAATVLAAGLTLLPSSVQEAQANPCSNSVDNDLNQGNGGGGDTVNGPSDDQECDLTGYFEFDE